LPAAAGVERTHPLWGRGFRPFFLGASLHAALVVPLWLAIWFQLLPAPAWLAPVWWHAHEMLFGTVAAAIAGFLTTAAPVWSGARPLTGRPLLLLAALWGAGRLAMLAAGPLPVALVAAIDLAFLPALAVVLLRTLWGRAQRRNHGIVALVAALALANAAVQADALGLASGWAPRALRFAVDGVVVLIVVIGGRITPAFTANALRRAALPFEVTARAGLDRLAVVGVALFAVVDLAAPDAAIVRGVAGAAGFAVAARMLGWQTWRTRFDPLVWSLHAGLVWVAVGLLLVAADARGTAGLHALTAGAMGSMILAVMTRVGLGHTARPLRLPAGVVGAYLLVHAGALARVAAALAPAHQPPLLVFSGACWSAAFGLFAVVYAPILARPRLDGSPG